MTTYLTDEQFLARLEAAKTLEDITALNKIVHEHEAEAVAYSDFARQAIYSDRKVKVAEKGIAIQAQPVEIPQGGDELVEFDSAEEAFEWLHIEEPEPDGIVPPHIGDAIEESKE